jgi:ABC-2 type transport system permease protein
MGFGLIFIGIPPTAEEFCRIVLFLLLSMVYIALWLNLALFFSIKSKQPATSALSGIAVWLFFSLFYNIIMNVVGKALSPSPMAMPDQVVRYQKFMLNLLRFSPGELFQEITMTMLMPSVRSLGPLTFEQMDGAISQVPCHWDKVCLWYGLNSQD